MMILRKYFDDILIFFLMLGIFAYVVFGGIHSDMLPHAHTAVDMLIEGRLFSDNFLMYLMVNLFSGFSGDWLLIRLSLVLVVSVCKAMEYSLAKRYLFNFCNHWVNQLCSFAMLFIFVIPFVYYFKYIGFFSSASNMYLGYYVPNVWHNTTIICSMPFAIVTYFLAIKQLEEFDPRRNIFLSLVVISGVLVKPSFFFVFAIAYGAIMLANMIRYKRGGWVFARSLVPLLIGCIGVLYEMMTIYGKASDGSSIVLDLIPFYIGDYANPGILYVTISLMLPLLFSICYRKVWESQEFWMCLIMLVAAIGMYWCLHETGPRANDGNFSWQLIPAMWFTYCFILRYILNVVPVTTWDRMKKYTFEGLLGLHTISGVIYLVHFLSTGHYA